MTLRPDPGNVDEELVDTLTRRISDNAAAVRVRLDSWGRPEVGILPVTKGFGVEAVLAARAAGFHAAGENYAAELLTKAAVINELGTTESSTNPFAWHMIGTVQRRTIRALAAVVSSWDSVGRREVAESLARWAPGAHVLLQVNATGESTKSGLAPSAIPEFVGQCRDLGLVVDGLMTIGVAGDNVATKRAFSIVSDLRSALGLAQLSMGMSHDMALAVEMGSTCLRLGTALLGDRPVRRVAGGVDQSGGADRQ